MCRTTHLTLGFQPKLPIRFTSPVLLCIYVGVRKYNPYTALTFIQCNDFLILGKSVNYWWKLFLGSSCE